MDHSQLQFLMSEVPLYGLICYKLKIVQGLLAIEGTHRDRVLLRMQG